MNSGNRIVNAMRLVVDRYDIKHGIRQIHYCSSKRRNENRREKFRIPDDQSQCPVYKDNRCCGGCPLVKTCDYTTNCNCSGFTIGSLGSKERYFMLEDNFAKYGRIIGGKFDWDYYYANRRREAISAGKYVVLEMVDWLHIADDQKTMLKDKHIRYGKALTDIDKDGYLTVDLVLPKSEERMELKVHAKGLGSHAFDSLDFMSTGGKR